MDEVGRPCSATAMELRGAKFECLERTKCGEIF